MKLNKKSIFTTGLAVTLAAAMMIGGGTFAYLQGQTEDVVNNFKTNKVMVELAETTGNDYNIIPGTSEGKDPKVTVDNTVNAYVYVEVTDATDGLVTYEIAEGWNALEGVPNVYYREVAADAAEKEFAVLKEDSVSYDAALTNADMLNGNKLKEGIALSFKASAIQKDGFADAVAAYNKVPVTVTANDPSNAKDLNAAKAEIKDLLAQDKTVKLGSDLDGSRGSQKFITADAGKGVLDLNGKTITGRSVRWAEEVLLYAVGVKGQGTELTLTGNGTVNGGKQGKPNTAVYASDKAKVIIQNGTYYVGNSDDGRANSVIRADSGATVEIYGGKFYTSGDITKNYILNCGSGSNIIVYGGTFVNFDPSNTVRNLQNKNYVAEGYHVESATQDNGDVWYTVVKG